jgi:uncharacterized protein with LGFP repeats
MSSIDIKYNQLGGNSSFLGRPTNVEQVCPDGVGHFRHYEYGSIYWHPDTGAFEVHGHIWMKWESLGREKSVLGYPITDEKATPDGEGRYNQFQNGFIHSHPHTGTFETHGAILAKWESLGWEQGILGYPITDEMTTPDRKGRYNHFQHGSIYWHPDTEAFEVHGGIRWKWAKLGWENSFLGYPLTDEKSTPDKKGRYNHFQGGSIYWHPYIGSNEVHGAIRAFWANQGYENGTLGYPMSDELSTLASGRYSVFEGGVVYWKPGIGANMAAYLDMSPDIIVQMIDDEVKKVIAGTPLFYTGDTQVTKVHHWYEYEEKYHYRVMQLHFTLEAEVTGFNPDVYLDLFFTFEVKGDAVVVSLVREQHEVDSSWWEELFSFGVQEIYDSLVDTNLSEAMGQAIRKSVAIPVDRNLLAAQLQDNDVLRLFFGA